MRGAIPPLPQYVLLAWCLVKHRDNFTFLPLPVHAFCTLRISNRHPNLMYLNMKAFHEPCAMVDLGLSSDEPS
jgi:hypothetical protein